MLYIPTSYCILRLHSGSLKSGCLELARYEALQSLYYGNMYRESIKSFLNLLQRLTYCSDCALGADHAILDEKINLMKSPVCKNKI